MAAQLVDPHRHLVPEGRRHGVLAVRASGQQGVPGFLGEVRQQDEQLGQLREKDRVRPAHQQQLPGLRNVLGRRAPVDVAARIPLAYPVQLPDQGHQRVPGARQALPHGVQVEVRQVGPAGDFRRGLRRYDVEFGLGLRQGGFDVQPCLVTG